MYHQVLDNGLHIFVVPKPGFQKSYAFFATNYGGMDMKFKLDGQDMDTPAGVAHYLEHKMFDTKEGNALQELAANGASPNAFTSNAITGYYFESTEKFEENLRILLSFVSIPYFTKESVDKEQGIIGQEIGMIEDDPDWVVFMDLMQALYEKHPVRVSVAGSAESISHITAETPLRLPQGILRPLQYGAVRGRGRGPGEDLPGGPGDPAGAARRAGCPGDYGAQEPAEVCQPMIQREMEVSVPPVPAGIQGGGGPGGRGGLRQQLLGELACEALLGNPARCMPDSTGRGWSTGISPTGMRATPAALSCARGRARTRRECGRRWPPRRSGSHGRDRPRAVGAAEKILLRKPGAGR